MSFIPKERNRGLSMMNVPANRMLGRVLLSFSLFRPITHTGSRSPPANTYINAASVVSSPVPAVPERALSLRVGVLYAYSLVYTAYSTVSTIWFFYADGDLSAWAMSR